MGQKEHIFRLLLVSGILITFLRMAEDGQAGQVQTSSSEVSKWEDNAGVRNGDKSGKTPKKGLKENRSLTPRKLGLRLAGILKSGDEYAYALIVEEATGEQYLYGIGDSIKGARLLSIEKGSVVFEEAGRRHVLKLTGGSVTGLVTLEKTITFEPVLNMTGPPVDENVPERELPFFEPIYNSTGPPLDPKGVYTDLPEFVPVFNDSGPPAE